MHAQAVNLADKLNLFDELWVAEGRWLFQWP